MTELSFVDPKGELIVLEVFTNRIHRIITMKDGLPTYTTVEGLRFSPEGIVKEFPDLAGKPLYEIRTEGIKRFKEHLLKFTNEKDTVEYLKKDLEKYGYVLKMISRKGFRVEKL